MKWQAAEGLYEVLYCNVHQVDVHVMWQAALGGSVQVAQQYRDQLEPYLADNAYPKVQVCQRSTPITCFMPTFKRHNIL